MTVVERIYKRGLVKGVDHGFEPWLRAYLTSGGGTPGSEILRVKEVSSVRTPNFRKLRKRDLPFNNFQLNAVSIEQEQGLFWRRDQYGWVTGLYTPFSTSVLDYLGVAPAWQYRGGNIGEFDDGTTDDTAKSRLFDNAQGAKVNLAQAFAERHQVVNMVATTATRLAECYRSLRRGNINGAVKSLSLSRTPPKRIFDNYRTTFPKSPKDAAANAWLELQYGWKPLLSDIYDSCELLAEHMKAKPPILSVTGSANKRFSKDTQAIYHGAVVTTGHYKAAYSSRYYIEYTVDDQAAVILGKTGISNPALLAWELLPYSFVVDWFLPVGNYLEQFTAFDGLRFSRGYKQKKTKVSFHAYADFSRTEFRHDGQIDTELIVQAEVTTNQTEYVRTKLTSFPSPSPPKLKNPFSPSHLTSALSLLNNAFRR